MNVFGGVEGVPSPGLIISFFTSAESREFYALCFIFEEFRVCENYFCGFHI